MSLVDLFKGTIKQEIQINEASIAERKIICVKCNSTYTSSNPKVKLYEHSKDRVMCVCPDCSARFTIKKELIFTEAFLAAVAEKYKVIREREMTDEEREAKDAEREAKKAEKSAEKKRKAEQAAADRAFIEEEKRREKEERLSKMSPDKRLQYETKVERMKKARAVRSARTTEVDPDYM